MNDNIIAIIGAGPAGLMAAEIIAGSGKHVVVYDRKPSVGRKFLMAGRGGLNLTHSENMDDFLGRYREGRTFLQPFLEKFTPDDLQKWCEGLGQKTFTGSSGRIFPESMKASPLLRSWLNRLNQMGVQFELQHTWKGWDEHDNLLFETKTGEVKSVKSAATLLCLGGASWPELGSDGKWTELLNKSGGPVSPLRPSNCGFHIEWSDFIKQRFSGQPLKNISITHQGNSALGEAVISDKGIEGGVVYALSAPLRNSIEQNGMIKIYIDLRPNMSHERIIEKLNVPRGRQSFTTWLQKTASMSSLQTALLYEGNKEAQKLSPQDLASLIKAVPISLTATFGMERAISSAGGILVEVLNENLMIKSIPGVFAAGEMLDWEAPTGGYLLQACFATGSAAGHGILKYLS